MFDSSAKAANTSGLALLVNVDSTVIAVAASVDTSTVSEVVKKLVALSVTNQG